MPPRKSSQAVYFSARFNPTTSEEDAKTVEIIQGLIDSEEVNFKQIAEDAILARNGYTPEMFSRSIPFNWITTIEELLTHFQQEILAEIRKGGYASQQPEEGEEDSPFSRNFAKKFMQRQQRAVGDEE